MTEYVAVDGGGGKKYMHKNNIDMCPMKVGCENGRWTVMSDVRFC
jgi:hypothetical protein